MKKITFTKLILWSLTLTMLLSCFVACDADDTSADGNETVQNGDTVGSTGGDTPVVPTDTRDMADMAAEINAWKAEDFEETDETTEYIKVSVKGYGDIIIRLRTKLAPSNASGVQFLVPYKFYDGLTFHNIQDGYIQGGCPKGDGTGVSGISQRGEFADNGFDNPIKHVRGVVSMFRFEDQPNSGSCQFLILTKDCPQFDGNRSAMGYVVAGLEVVDAIAAAEATDGKPAERIVMETVRFVKLK